MSEPSSPSPAAMLKAGASCLTAWASVLLKSSDSTSHEARRNTRIVHGLLTAIFSRGTSAFATFLSVPLTVGYLGAERYGVWMTISTLLTWMTLADFGLGNSLTNALAKAYAEDRRDLAQTYVASVFWMLCAASACLALISAAIWRWIDWAALLNVTSPLAASEVGPAVAVTLAIFLFNFPLSIVSRILSAYQQSAVANFWTSGGSVMTLVGLIVATRLKVGLVPLIAAYSASTLLIAAASAVWLFGYYKPWLRPRLSAVHRESVRSLTSIGGMFFVTQIAALLILQTDNLVIAHYIGAQAVTPYSVTWRLFTCSTLVQGLLLQSLWPAYAEAFTRRDGPWIRRTFRFNLLTNVALTLLIVIPLVVFGRVIVSRWAGPAAMPSQLLLVLMGIWSVIGGAFQSIVCMLNGLSRVRAQMRIGLTTAVANIGFAIFFVQHFGVEGVVLGTLVAYLVCALIPTFLETKIALNELN